MCSQFVTLQWSVVEILGRVKSRSDRSSPFTALNAFQCGPTSLAQELLNGFLGLSGFLSIS